MGYVAWIGKYEEDDSVLTSLLHKAGAVFYIKTSVPQSLMVCETVNNIIGRTLNPRNKNWSCGGSSGGEGALVGFRGSVIGVGTDIGKLNSQCHCDSGILANSSRWLNSCPVCLQLLIWLATKPWAAPLRQNGE